VRGLLALVRREVGAAFASPVAYTIMFGFLVIVALGFLYRVTAFSALPPMAVERTGASIRTYVFGGWSLWVNIAVLLSLPALSMRLFTEERKAGTIELLLTSPITTAHLVLGKYLGTVVIYALMLLLTAPLVGTLAVRAPLEWGAIGAAYLAFLLYGAVLLAVGAFASSLTENQIVAVVLTYAFFLPFYLVELAVGAWGPPLDDVLAGVALGVGLRDYARGLADSHFLVLSAALSFAFLFLTMRVLDSNRWR
jgi:ABC-2 type transport system permease protein